jgi:hypothetical protein
MHFVGRIGRMLLLAVPMMFIGQGCTDLSETPHDALTPENAFKTETELLAGVAAVYAALRPIDQDAGDGFSSLEDLTADVLIVPTRGSDWYDNGQWLDMHRQTWTANSAGTLSFLNAAWNTMFSGIAKANLMIDVVTKAGGANAARTTAELRVLRALFYYILQDEFGGVPVVTSTKLERVARAPRDSVFRFIESELIASIPDLPDSWPSDGYGRVTKGAANALLASLYINAGVFSKETGVSPTAYNTCLGITVAGGKDACQAAIDAADAVINSGMYSLSTSGNWAENFSRTNTGSPENIFVIVYTSESTQGLGGNWPFRTLHYAQLSSGWGGPWNGFATLAETYNSFDATDERRNMWLVGPQRSFETGKLVTDRATNPGDTLTNPLSFTVSIPNAEQANEAHGVRFNKFPPLPSAPTGNGMPNDFPIFRLTEMYLIKAEALLAQGNAGTALTQLQTIHNLRDAGTPVGAATQATILRERLLEFSGEGKRRTDMIRMGKFLSWTEASANGVSSTPRDAHLLLFPIPVTQLGSNPLLVQNPGY